MENKHRAGEVIAVAESGAFRLDSKDREIISILTANSRTSFSQIAKALRSSNEVISYRYSNLRKKRIITDSTPSQLIFKIFLAICTVHMIH